MSIIYIKDIILIKQAMLVTWVKCEVIFENGDKKAKMLFALHSKTRLYPSNEHMIGCKSKVKRLIISYMERKAGDIHTTHRDPQKLYFYFCWITTI